MDLYEDLGCGAAGTLWPRAGAPGPTWQYLGTLTLDAAPPSLDVSVVAQVQGDAPPPPGPPAGRAPLPCETQGTALCLWCAHAEVGLCSAFGQ